MLWVHTGKTKPAALRIGFVCFLPLLDTKLVPKQGERPWKHFIWRGGGNFLSGIQVECNLKSLLNNGEKKGGGCLLLDFMFAPGYADFLLEAVLVERVEWLHKRCIRNPAAVDRFLFLNNAFSFLGLNLLTQSCCETELFVSFCLWHCLLLIEKLLKIWACYPLKGKPPMCHWW